jgi:hypothetical protein
MEYPPALLAANSGSCNANSNMVRSALFRSMPGRLLIAIPAGICVMRGRRSNSESLLILIISKFQIQL